MTTSPDTRPVILLDCIQCGVRPFEVSLMTLYYARYETVCPECGTHQLRLLDESMYALLKEYGVLESSGLDNPWRPISAVLHHSLDLVMTREQIREISSKTAKRPSIGTPQSDYSADELWQVLRLPNETDAEYDFRVYGSNVRRIRGYRVEGTVPQPTDTAGDPPAPSA